MAATEIADRLDAMFDLREISLVAPVADIAIGIVMIAVAVLIANLAVVPALNRGASNNGKWLLGFSLAGIVAVIAVLANWPTYFFGAVAHYIAGFSLLALFLAWPVLGWRSALSRALLGLACMAVAFSIAGFMAHLPR